MLQYLYFSSHGYYSVCQFVILWTTVLVYAFCEIKIKIKKKFLPPSLLFRQTATGSTGIFQRPKWSFGLVLAAPVHGGMARLSLFCAVFRVRVKTAAAPFNRLSFCFLVVRRFAQRLSSSSRRIAQEDTRRYRYTPRRTSPVASWRGGGGGSCPSPLNFSLSENFLVGRKCSSKNTN